MYIKNAINITVYTEKCLITPEAVLSPAGYSYVTHDTVITPSREFVLIAN